MENWNVGIMENWKKLVYDIQLFHNTIKKYNSKFPPFFSFMETRQ